MRSFALILLVLGLVLNVPSLSANESTESVKSQQSSPTARKQQERKPDTQTAQTQKHPLNSPIPSANPVVGETKAEQKKDNPEHNPQWSSEWLSNIDGSGWAQVIVAGIGLWIIWRTLKAVERQAESTHVTADAARDSTDIAQTFDGRQ